MTRTREECIEIIGNYRRKGWVRPNKGIGAQNIGNKKGPCIRCGSSEYDFHEGRFKDCPDCGFSTFFNTRIRIVQNTLKKKGDMDLSLEILNGFCDYIEGLEPIDPVWVALRRRI